jgi:hypothetical protein
MSVGECQPLRTRSPLRCAASAAVWPSGQSLGLVFQNCLVVASPVSSAAAQGALSSSRRPARAGQSNDSERRQYEQDNRNRVRRHAGLEASGSVPIMSTSGLLMFSGNAEHSCSVMPVTSNSPAGGQGLNTGTGDASNLGWKLTAVLKGNAASLLLDSYSAERIAVAHYILRSSDREPRSKRSDFPRPARKARRFLRLGCRS